MTLDAAVMDMVTALISSGKTVAYEVLKPEYAPLSFTDGHKEKVCIGLNRTMTGVIEKIEEDRGTFLIRLLTNDYLLAIDSPFSNHRSLDAINELDLDQLR